jgi:hypothetical protein
VPCLPVAGIAGSDVPGMLKQVNSELRAVQKDMFNGRTEKAIVGLENLNDTLVKVKEADPDNPKLKQAEKKFQKLVKDLERRTGKDLGGVKQEPPFNHATVGSSYFTRPDAL